MRFTILILFLVCYGLSFAQRHPYHTSDSILNHAYQDNPNRPDFENKAWEFSFINQYKEALKMWDSAHIQSKNLKLSFKDSLYFHRFKPVNAKEYILERAKKGRIIIFNEAHHQPLHRVFPESLLPELYKIGYRFLGCETVPYHADSAMNARKYPNLSDGYYIVQTQFGNMVRTALNNGYYVFGYESKGEATPTEREIQQAQHIKTFLDANPGANIVIYCGFGHALKSDLPIWEKSMAQRIQEYTGIEPFCIDQVRLTERSSSAYEDPLYRTINLNYYALFVDSAGNLYHGEEGSHDYDAILYHPRTKFTKGRPHWVFENGRKPFFVHANKAVTYPCLVFAYPDGEDVEKAVPVDVIEIKNEKDNKALALQSGIYVIVFKDNTGLEQQFAVEVN